MDTIIGAFLGAMLCVFCLYLADLNRRAGHPGWAGYVYGVGAMMALSMLLCALRM